MQLHTDVLEHAYMCERGWAFIPLDDFAAAINKSPDNADRNMYFAT